MTMTFCRPFDLAAVRDALTAALQAGTYMDNAMRVNPWFADTFDPPCALVGTFTINFSDDNYDQLTTATVSVRLVVPTQALRAAQKELDAILVAAVDALNADPTLNKTVLRVLPQRATPIGTTRGNVDLASYDLEVMCVL